MGTIITVTAYTGGGCGLPCRPRPLRLNVRSGSPSTMNSTHAASEVLTEFRFIDLDLMGTGPLGSAVIFDLRARSRCPTIRNGTGIAD